MIHETSEIVFFFSLQDHLLLLQQKCAEAAERIIPVIAPAAEVIVQAMSRKRTQLILLYCNQIRRILTIS